MNRFECRLWARLMACTCAVLIGIPPGIIASLAREDVYSRYQFILTNKSDLVRVRFLPGEVSATALGLKFELSTQVRLASLHASPAVFVGCNDRRETLATRVSNVTATCFSFSIITSEPVRVSIPYDPSALPDGVSEQAVKLFEVSRIAANGPMTTLDAQVDLENKTTVATLSQMSGRFINGVLKAGERPDKAPSALSSDSLKSLRSVDTVAGRPIIQPPQANTDGDLRLSYPVDFPGARPGLRPQLTIGYSAQSPRGNIADGWRLSAPAITIETKWGVPIYDPSWETETYLFNGEQLVPEAGDYIVDGQSEDSSPSVEGDDRKLATLHLVSMPHRTTKLRPRKLGKAHFVMRRDEGLWRFVRHGDTPSTYWWEAWQENPGSDVAKVSYFGRAPGRIDDDVKIEALPNAEVSDVIRRDDGNSAPIIRWALSRDKDSFGNLVDYYWSRTCLNCNYPIPLDRDLYLSRLIYSSHQDVEETLLRCREEPTLAGCRRKQGVYDVLFSWTDASLAFPSYVDGRFGGLVVSNRLLTGIDYRFRRRPTVEKDGSAMPIKVGAWNCSKVFLAYRFHRERDPLYQVENGARQWLVSIGKVTPKQSKLFLAASESAIFPEGLDAGLSCTTYEPLKDGLAKETSPDFDVQATRLAYKQPALIGGTQTPFQSAQGYPLAKDIGRPSLSDMTTMANGFVSRIIGGDGKGGPFAASVLGANETQDVSGGLYTGIAFGSSKLLSAGLKTSFTSRLSHNESTLLVDVDGDGVVDLLVRSKGRWTIHKGAIAESGRLSFGSQAASPLPHGLPFGFRFQHEPVMSSRSLGFEGYFGVGMAGVSSQRSTSIQTTYLADMDADGRVDVVTPGGVFYNRSNADEVRGQVHMGFDTPFVRSEAAVLPDRAQLAAAIAPDQDIAISNLSARSPRYDTVRAWRAPFAGHVLVRGNAKHAGRGDALLDEGVVGGIAKPTAREPDIRYEDVYRPRDGLIVAVERSRGVATLRCDQHFVGASVLTPPATPKPDRPGTWRLAGSLMTRKGEDAQYFITLSRERPGTRAPAAGRSVRLSIADITTDESDRTVGFGAAVSAAVKAWAQLHGPGLRFDEALGILTYVSDKPMEPLIVTLGTAPKPDTRAIDKRFVVSLSDASSSGAIAPEMANVTTRLADGAFTPRGHACLTEGDIEEVGGFANRVSPDSGLLLSVKPDDVVYFRVNSIDDGNGDAVSWNPEISYLRAEESVPPYVGDFAPWRALIDFSPATLATQGVVESSTDNCALADTPLCRRIIDLLSSRGTVCHPAEPVHGLCDVTGRSLLRYRPARDSSISELARVGAPAEPGDYPVLALSSGQLAIGKTGQVRLSGSIRKPATPGQMRLELGLLPKPAEKKPTPSCDPHRVPVRAIAVRAANAKGVRAATLDASAGVFSIDTEDPSASLFVREGETLCLFLRHAEPGEPSATPLSFRMWPYDSAAVVPLTEDPITVAYRYIVETIPIGQPQPVSAFPQSADPVNCAPGGDLGALPGNANGLRLHCAEVELAQRRFAIYAAPHAVNGVIDQISVGDQSASPKSPFGRYHRSSLPTAQIFTGERRDWSKLRTLECSVPAAEAAVRRFERRFVVDTRTQSERPQAWRVDDPGLGQRIARLKTMLFARGIDGENEALEIRPFAIQKRDPGGSWKAIPIEPRHLGAAKLLEDERFVLENVGPRLSIRQDFRVLAQSVGTTTVTPFASDEPSLAQALLSSEFVGFSVCARDTDVVIAVSSLDEDSDASNARTSRLLGATACVADGLSKAPVGPGSDVFLRRPEHICPLVAADLKGATFERHARSGSDTTEIWNFDAQPLAIAISPRPYAERPSDGTAGGNPNPDDATAVAAQDINSPRIQTALNLHGQRGSYALAIRYEGLQTAGADREIRDPLLPRDTALGPSLIDDPTQLVTLPALKKLSSDIAGEIAGPNEGKAIQETAKNAAEKNCGAADDTSPLDVEIRCSDIAASVPLLNTAISAYPLGTAYRIARFADDGRVGSARGGGNRGESGEDGAVAGTLLEDQACSDTPLVNARIDRVGTETPSRFVKAGEARISASVRGGAGLDPKPPRLCTMGPDNALWVSDELMSASRIGVKNIHQGERTERLRAKEIVSAPAGPATGVGLRGLPRISTTEARSNVGGIIGYSRATGESATQTGVDVIDMNGDGFPDLIVDGKVTYTDPAGSFRCAKEAVWSGINGCRTPDQSTNRSILRETDGEVRTEIIALPPNVPTFPREVGAGRAGGNTSGSGLNSKESGATQSPRFGLGISVDKSETSSGRKLDTFDVNGDGLPDLVSCPTSGGECSVQLNLGYGFAAASPWHQASALFSDRSSGRGLGVSASFATSDGAFAGGATTGTGSSFQAVQVADINGDGLPDVIEQDSGNNISVRLSTGRGLTAPVPLGGIDRPMAASESDRISLGGAYTYAIPLVPIFFIFLIVNPEASTTATLTRQPILFRDVDGDGAPDLVLGEGVARDRTTLPRLNFNNQTAVVLPNLLAQHGLLEHVWLPTNPSKPEHGAVSANYSFVYGRTAKTADDPGHRFVLRGVTVRDGISVDDAPDVVGNARHTCFSYGSGFFDRFERRFLGYGRIDQVEGCATEPSRIALVHTAGARDRDEIEGLRRIERMYANRTVYEAGLMLEERVFDLASPLLGKDGIVPHRRTIQTHVLIDTALSSHARIVCHAPRGQALEPETLTLQAAGFAPAYLPATPAKLFDGVSPQACRSTFGDSLEAFRHSDPHFDVAPRRLTTALVQTVRETRETLSGPDSVLRTAVQTQVDHLARPAQVCDLGEVALGADGKVTTRGAVCAGMVYDQSVRPAFTHGATGGGTVLVEQRNRVRDIVVADFRPPGADLTAAADAPSVPDIRPANDNVAGFPGTHDSARIVRRRTAAHDPRSGALASLCQFSRFQPGATDPCEQYAHFPRDVERLDAAAAGGVALRAFQYDRFGNLERYIGPMATGRSFVTKTYKFDSYLSSIETVEITNYCVREQSAGHSDKRNGDCLNTISAMGRLISRATMIDYRHAVATASADVNGHVTSTVLDPLGRPTAVFATWANVGPSCASESDCTLRNTPDELRDVRIAPDQLPGALRAIARYSYADGEAVPTAHGGPRATVEMFQRKDVFRQPGVAAFAEALGALRSPTLSFADHFGKVVQQVTPHESCLDSKVSSGGAILCGSSAQWVASGVAASDALGRVAMERYPVAVAAGTALPAAVTAPQPGAPSSVITYDGIDRRLIVRLPDGNGYDLAYRVALSMNHAHPMVRHRTDMRDALCTPSALERDARGSIRTVVEASRDVVVEGRTGAALASSAHSIDAAAIKKAGQVKEIVADAAAGQQVYECTTPRGGAISFDGLRQTVTAYDHDALGQLVAVRLPERSGGKQANRPSADSILVAYDGLGRRILVDDPDRGFERIQHDSFGNAMCRYSGARRGNLTRKDIRPATFAQLQTAVSPSQADSSPSDIAVNPNACPDPSKDDPGIVRITRSAHLAGLPVATAYKVFDADDKDAELAAARRAIRLTYGIATVTADRDANRIGRAYRTADPAGMEDRTYDGLGRLVTSRRTFTGLATGGKQSASATLVTTEDRDAWGLLASRRFQITVPGYGATTQPKSVDETVAYRYALGGQVAEVFAGSGSFSALAPIASDFQYDERSNLLGHVNAVGIATSNTYAPQSNRLLTSRSVIDLADPTISALSFQNLSYQYDATGNVLAYSNIPMIAGPCLVVAVAGERVPGDCALTERVARAYGMTVKRSDNAFSYDQMNRLRTARKTLEGIDIPRLDKDGEPQVIDSGELMKAKPLDLTINETFAFEPTHEMSVLARQIESTVAGKKATRSLVANYVSDGRPRHAPGRIDATIRVDGKAVREKTTFGFDKLGRMEASLCELSNKKGCNPDRYFGWNADDTMETQTVEIPDARLPEAKKGKGVGYYDHVLSTFDATGRRTRKELWEQTWRPSNPGDKPDSEEFQAETLYADPQLTIARRRSGDVQAMVHYFAGSLRLASRWVGDDKLFTYHAHLLTRNVTDIAVGQFTTKPGLPRGARIHGQQEYAAFGEIVHERENSLPGGRDGQTARMRSGLVSYRFNAKEQDESGLQDFGARFYDNKLALWLRPDPVLHAYLDGGLNGGVFASKNLASYGFGWGNPTRFVDNDGRAVGDAVIGFMIADMAIPDPSDVVPLKWVGYGLAATGIAILANDRIGEILPTSAESRSAPPQPLPEAKGHDHSILEPGGGYTTWEGNKAKQFRPEGRPHGNQPRPNVKEFTENTAPNGHKYINRPDVRAPRPDEIRPRPANDNIKKPETIE